jgi:hypothetical protein
MTKIDLPTPAPRLVYDRKRGRNIPYALSGSLLCLLITLVAILILR